MDQHFENVSLLITHYNRSASLKRLLSAFKALNLSFGEIIVSDDCSSQQHLDKIKNLQQDFDFKLVTTPVNKGLGNNINKGQDAVSKPYTLYVQEDFVPKNIFPEHFADALGLMDKYPDMDIARFYGYFPYVHREPFEKGFEKMIFDWWYPSYVKFHYYSDHPHLRRSTFLQKFGRYKEGVNVDIAEYSMVLSFLKNKGKGFIFHQIDALFDQLNNADEPSTAAYRQDWKNSPNLFIKAMRGIYLQYKTLKYHKDLLFFKKNDAK